MKRPSLLFTLFATLSILSFNCTQKKELNMEETRIVQGTFTVIEDDLTPPPPFAIKAKFKTINEWLTAISKEEKLAQQITSYNIGLIESPEEHLLYLTGTNITESEDTTYVKIDFTPKEMYFLIPQESYKGLSREKLIDKLASELQNFVKTDAFKNSYFANATNFIFETNGQILWQRKIE